MKAQCEDEILKASKYQNKELKTETSTKTKRSYGFKSDILCMFAGGTCEEGQFTDIIIKEEEDRKNLNYVLKGEETVKSHINSHTQVKEVVAFQHTVNPESREGSLAHDDGQK